MPLKNGIITRKDLLEDEALKWGEEYKKHLEEAIAKNNELIKSTKELNTAIGQLRASQGQTDFINAQKATEQATRNAIAQLKLQEQAEISAEKTKRAKIQTMEAERRANEAKNKATQSSIKLTLEERVQNEVNNRALKQEARERLGLVGAYEKLNKERTAAKRTLMDLMASENASTESIKRAQKEFENLDNKVRKADKAVGDFTKNVGNYPISMGSIAGGLKDLVGAFGITAGIGAVVGIMKGAYTTIKEFEQSLADLSAITGATGKDLAYLESQAIELGKSTKGGAKNVVEAYKLIGSAKPELLSNVSALNEVTEATLLLSKASGMELPDSAKALTDAMNQFGADASQATMFVDALANGAKFGAAEIPQVTEALLKFGAVARSSNVSIQESTALVELLAEKGLKGAEAGTALRNVLLKISAPDALPKEAQKTMQELGISFEMLKDKSIPIQEKFEALKPLLKDNAYLVKVFGNENLVSARNVIENTSRLKELTAQMNTNGTALEQANKRTDTLQAKTEELSATYDSFILSMNKGSGPISGFFKIFVDGAKTALNELIRLNTSWDELNQKAREKGTKEGKAEFNRSFNTLKQQKGNGTDADKAKDLVNMARKKLIENINKQKSLKKDLKVLDEGDIEWLPSTLEHRNMKRANELLEKDIAYQAGIMKSGKEKINAILNPKKTQSPKDATAGDVAVGGASKAPKTPKAPKAEKVDNSGFELAKQRLEQEISINREILKDDEMTQEERLQALSVANEKQITLLRLNRDQQLKEKDLTENSKIKIEEDFQFKLLELQRNTGEELQKLNLFDDSKYKKDLDNKLSDINIAQNDELQAENERFAKLGDLEAMKQEEREKKIEEHEKNVFDIKKRYATDALKLQISSLDDQLKANDALPSYEQISAEKRRKIEEELSKAKLGLSELELQNHKTKSDSKVLTEREQAEKILEITQNFTNALSGLANALFEGKIANIDAEITKSDEFYNREIELAGDDKRKKEIIQKEAEKKRQELEKKKREEQHKQAVFNKAMSVAEISLSTAQAVMKAYAQLGPIGGTVGAVLAGVLGAIQLAAVLATPIPKYKMGRKGGKEELAIVGDGGRSEIIERASGKIELTPATDTLVKLNQGDSVYKSIDDYYQNAMFSDFRKQKDMNVHFDNHNKELVEEMRLTRKAIEKNKTNVNVNVPKTDFAHEFWKIKNTNWS